MTELTVKNIDLIGGLDVNEAHGHGISILMLKICHISI